ncbi:N(4)-(Beta-N-acetylglucosaminyl)-L-asparaginase-like [Agrilus planipennis]|uniref:N(4)-(beta-N-acetylglucosaminyl)-L-asparaginase n=1 Tax=Agrilus planipennis TaxID=224129 RepID=A0A1W4XUG5_AGRPL|nr:N(4)-(Beta-N-acetylglucosaminyl)-L-asparaginase-like [Agrilus planipennis]
MNLLILIFLSNFIFIKSEPIVINTWKFTEATREAWKTLQETHNSIDALVAGCSKCEQLQCDHTVGFGGSPDENGETTLDALIFDGLTMNVGAVANLRRIKNAIAVAEHVLKYTGHSILAGELATQFAVQMGFKEETLTTSYSKQLHTSWAKSNCQPNFWKNVDPDPKTSCGPYTPANENSICYNPSLFDSENHDTIGMVVIDKNNHIVAGTSTNGANHKIPGRVGDSPIPGAGAYAENNVGGASGTGDGDVMMRFLPSFLTVEEMRRGSTPTEAALTAIKRVAAHYPNFFGAVIAVNVNGEYGAACNGMDEFHFSVFKTNQSDVKVQSVLCNK